ncbi:MAG: hypothetical protein WCK35_25710, partial [Chloroflexota bacterium]
HGPGQRAGLHVNCCAADGALCGCGWLESAVPALLVYTAVAIHYVLPFQHVAILLGQGETGGYSTRHVLKYGLPLTIVALIVIIPIEVTWWHILGLL